MVIGTRLAQQLHVKPGDEIEVDTARQGKQKLRVAALAIDYMVGGEIMFIHRTTAEKLFDVQGVNTIVVTARPEASARYTTPWRRLPAAINSCCTRSPI